VGTVTAVETYVVRLWLPDRPGVLGQVAGRIGDARGDVVGIEILERGGGMAIDELTVALPDAAFLDVMVSGLLRIDGVAVEDVRTVRADRPDGALAVLTTAAVVVAAAPGERLAVACRELRHLLDADWAVAACLDAPEAAASDGPMPELEWLAAFLAGSDHLPGGAGLQHTPGDLVWSRVPRHGVALVCGRQGRVFHARERDEFHVLGGIVDSLPVADAIDGPVAALR
jgi:hypothetical protein